MGKTYKKKKKSGTSKGMPMKRMMAQEGMANTDMGGGMMGGGQPQGPPPGGGGSPGGQPTAGGQQGQQGLSVEVALSVSANGQSQPVGNVSIKQPEDIKKLVQAIVGIFQKASGGGQGQPGGQPEGQPAAQPGQ